MTEVQIKPIQSKSMDWFLYDRDLHYESVNVEIIIRKSKKQEVKFPGANAHSSFFFFFESHDAISLWITSQNLLILENWVCMFHRIKLNSRINFRSSHRRCSVKNVVLKRFTKFTGKQLCPSLFFNKIACLRPATSGTGAFLWILRNF